MPRVAKPSKCCCSGRVQRVPASKPERKLMSISDSLIEAWPDLTLVVRSDGVIVGNIGGKRLGIASEPGELTGSSLRQVWTADIADHLNLLVRRTLRTRSTVDRHYNHQG